MAYYVPFNLFLKFSLHGLKQVLKSLQFAFIKPAEYQHYLIYSFIHPLLFFSHIPHIWCQHMPFIILQQQGWNAQVDLTGKVYVSVKIGVCKQ